MPKLPAATATVRHAVRSFLTSVAPVRSVLVGCSGGPDSVALAAAAAFVGPRMATPVTVGAIIVDHQWHPESAAVADQTRRTCTDLGLTPVQTTTVATDGAGGPEAAARDARYAAFDTARREAGADWVLLGHTADDQAETVLLRLLRGSGVRSLAGMPQTRGTIGRPLLGVRRADTHQMCAESDLTTWQDPSNADDQYARARVRHHLLPAATAALGPGVVDALVRTATLSRADAEFLEDTADQLAESVIRATADDVRVAVVDVAQTPEALRWRVLRAAALAAGCPADVLGFGHIRAVDDLVVRWHGQQAMMCPGGMAVSRTGGDVVFQRVGN